MCIDLQVQFYLKNYFSTIFVYTYFHFLKQPFRGVLRKSCYWNMQQIYKRKPMPKCDFNKVVKQLYWNRTSAYVFSCKFNAYIRSTFSSELVKYKFFHVSIVKQNFKRFQSTYFWIIKKNHRKRVQYVGSRQPQNDKRVR